MTAAENASFATPGGKGGWFCTTPMIAVARAVSRKRALEMIFTGEAIDARTALAWGLVNRVVPAEELEASAASLAGRLAAGPAGALAAIKRSVNRAQSVGFEEAIDFEFHLQAALMAKPDFAEGVAAFLEKRAPRFGGA